MSEETSGEADGQAVALRMRWIAAWACGAAGVFGGIP